MRTQRPRHEMSLTRDHAFCSSSPQLCCVHVGIALELIKSGQKSVEMGEHLCFRKGDIIAHRVTFFRLTLNCVLKDVWILRVGLERFLTWHLFNAFSYKTIAQDCSPSKLVISKLWLIPVTYLVRITWNELKTSNVVWNLHVLAAAKPSPVFGHSPILAE